MLMIVDTDWSSISSAALEVTVLYPVPSNHHVLPQQTHSSPDTSLVIALVYVFLPNG
jgi:hypothetical protein